VKQRHSASEAAAERNAKQRQSQREAAAEILAERNMKLVKRHGYHHTAWNDSRSFERRNTVENWSSGDSCLESQSVETLESHWRLWMEFGELWTLETRGDLVGFNLGGQQAFI
jgi:hypothetical protein